MAFLQNNSHYFSQNSKQFNTLPLKKKTKKERKNKRNKKQNRNKYLDFSHIINKNIKFLFERLNRL